MKIKVILSVIACAVLFGGWSCNSKQVNTFDKSYALAVAVADSTLSILSQPCTAPGLPYGCGQIAPDEYGKLHSSLADITACGKTIKTALDAKDVNAIRLSTTSCEKTVDDAIVSGVAGIKNPAAQSQASALFFAIKTVLNAVLNTLDNAVASDGSGPIATCRPHTNCIPAMIADIRLHPAY